MPKMLSKGDLGQTGFFKDSTGKGRNIIERITGAPKNIPTDHAFIHVGLAFKTTVCIGTMAHSTSVSYSLKTPADKYLHFKDLRLTATAAPVSLELIRGTADNELDIDSPGESATDDLIGPNNLNDTKDIQTGVVIRKTPTYEGTKEGETWDRIVVPGSSTNQFKSAEDAKLSDNFEYVMKPDTYYVIKFTNQSTEDSALNVVGELFWYEEDEG